jgi:protein MpaA
MRCSRVADVGCGGGPRAPAERHVAALLPLLTVWSGGCAIFGSAGNGPDAAAPATPDLVWREIATSVQGRPLRATTLGTGPRQALWIGGIHGDEREGEVATERLPAAFLAVPGAAEKVTLTVLEDANPDGTALGVRWNANAVDLNRNYPASNFRTDRRFGREPLSQPESKALHDLILSVQPHIVIVVHSWRGDHFINFDGPGEELAAVFAELSGYRVRASDEIAPTPGSLGSWVGRDLRIPILTLEYLRGRNPHEAWRETKDAILAVILGE